nr:phospho-sugar mutase [Euzebyales bacterium]
FAEDAARVLAGAGIRVHALAGLTPTPLLAFAVRRLDAAAGVQVTASHNPAADNGYKVYWGDGAQIVPPLDAEISAAIDAVASLDGLLLAAAGDPLVTEVPDTLRDAYADAVLPLLVRPQERDLRIVTTPLHGVAAPLLTDLLSRAGFDDVAVVPQQAEPDPDFPTVSFPNPEEPGALDLALDLARERDADVVLANDPDGDRIAAAVPTAAGWRVLSGDETGCLLADWLLTEGPQDHGRVVATTVVSSQLLSRIAADHGVGYAETLTGFKWLARAALDAAAGGGRMVLAYEQALGAMCGTAVLDKDGISAAMVFAEMAAAYKASGGGVPGALDALARRHGVHATTGRSIRLQGPHGQRVVAEVLRRLRADPPAQVGGVPVIAVADHAAGRRVWSDGRQEQLTTPATDLVAITLRDGSRLQVRPSGTEPLLKFYLEVVEPAGDEVATARGRAAARLSDLADTFLDLTAV